MKKVLLHICCGVCALHCIERLQEEGFYVEGFFFNPNIHPEAEYIKRKETLDTIRQIFSTKIIEGRYEPKAWQEICALYKDEKEGGRRCLACYEMRLMETKKTAEDLKYDCFTTTLTISPHKNSSAIIGIGKKLNADNFLALDFKKKDGFKKTMQLAKKHNFYHQNYCGCVYSIRGQMAEDRR